MTIEIHHDETTWEEFVSSQPRTRFLQSWTWGEFQQALGHRVHRLGVRVAGTLIGACQLIETRLPLGFRYQYAPHGPMVTDDPALEYSDVLKTIREYVRDHEPPSFLRADPLLPPSRNDQLRARGWRPTLPTQPQHTWVLDCTPDEDSLLNAMHHKTRYNIRLAEKKGVTVRRSTDPAEADRFHAFVTAVNQRERIRSFSAAYYRTMLKVLAPHGLAELLIAEYQETPIAAVQLIHYGDTSTYNHGGSSDAYRNLMAPHLLQWAAIRRAKERGSHWYDFRGIAGSDNPSDPWAGITRFKKGFGGGSESLVGTWDFPYTAFGYFTYTLLRRLRRSVG